MTFEEIKVAIVIMQKPTEIFPFIFTPPNMKLRLYTKKTDLQKRLSRFCICMVS
jgi:hypothetical protein